MPESLRLRLLGLRDLSEGSSDNLQLLRHGRADLGFVQRGSARKTDDADTASPPVALGSLFLEPVWLFYRTDAALRATGSDTLGSLAPLQGLRVNVGTAGSGVPLKTVRRSPAFCSAASFRATSAVPSPRDN